MATPRKIFVSVELEAYCAPSRREGVPAFTAESAIPYERLCFPWPSKWRLD